MAVVGDDDEYARSADVTATCAARCVGDVTARAVDRRFAGVWQAAWAALSVSAALVSVATFVLDSARFAYPERPVLYVAVCRYIRPPTTRAALTHTRAARSYSQRNCAEHHDHSRRLHQRLFY